MSSKIAESGGMDEGPDVDDDEDILIAERKLADIQKQKDEADHVAGALEKKSKAEAAHKAYARKWGAVFYIYPLFPVILSLCTIFFGSIIVNSADHDACTNSFIPIYMFGNIVLSYLLVIFYTIMLVGIDMPFCGLGRFRYTVRSYTVPFLFSIPYCLAGFVWNIIGTAQFASKTTSSCETGTPSLYYMTMVEIIFFWVSVVGVMGLFLQRWFISKYAEKLRKDKQHKERLRKLREQDEKIAFEEQQARIERDEDEAVEAEDAEKAKADKAAKAAHEAEMKKKYGDSSDDGEGDDDDEEEEEEEDEEEDSDEDEEEEDSDADSKA